ncbi:MAG TPA: hypothetical protein VNP37_21660 [Actinomycetospora sp.]|nr:hypothetical protein [Actinomycetospora sp.]
MTSVGTRAAGFTPLTRAPLTGPLPDLLRRRSVAVTTVLLAATVLAYGVLVVHRAWISDDGLIFLRTVRQLLAGNGPVFNVGERVEANTSTLWTAVLALLALVPGVRPELLSVGAGVVLSVTALALALDASRRFAALGRVVVPAGALVLLALPPFWDFGTSGLETSLSFCWLAGLWWLLVVRSQRAPQHFAPARRRPGRAWPTAFVAGLGPLVRPDLALVGVIALVVLVLLEQPRSARAWARMAGLGAVAAALPLAYEVFRAGYYGLLVPATALAKEAGVPRWERGVVYLRDLVSASWLGVPALALALAAVLLARPVWRRRSEGPADADARRTRAWDDVATAAVALAPLVAGTAMVLYVVRVGGDFMHARMLLPAVFCLLLPVMALPLRRVTVVPLAVVLVWAGIAGTSLRPPYDGIGPGGIADERGFYTELLADENPLTADDYRRHPHLPAGVAAVARAAGPVLAVRAPGDGPAGPEWQLIPLRPGEPSGLIFLNLGVAGALAPLDVRVSDTVGLVDPLAAHSSIVPFGRVGHDKSLPTAWDVAAGGGTPPDDRAASPGDVAAAARALQCPALRELDASVRAPLTPERFWANLTGAWDRTALRIPRDPVLAELACPTPP